MHPKDKFPLYLKTNIVYICFCPEEIHSNSYTGESSRCIENRVKEHNSYVTSVIYIHSESSRHPCANISHFKIIEQDIKEIAREAILYRINNSALNFYWGK